MYGTVAKIQIKPGKYEAFKALIDEQSQQSAGAGAVEVAVFQTDENPETLFMIAIFEDKDKYFQNADRPETDENFQKMAQYFAREPEWHDGEVVYYQKFD